NQPCRLLIVMDERNVSASSSFLYFSIPPRPAFDKLAVSLEQRRVQRILGCYLARRQVSSRQIVGDFAADEVVEILQVAFGERGEEFALALLGWDGLGLLAPQFFSPRQAFIEG